MERWAERGRGMKRLLMYSQDGNGLGHLRRTFNIARQLRRRNPRCDIVIVADSPAASIVGSTPGIDLLKLPTVVKAGASSWVNATLALPTKRVIKLRSELMLRVFAEFRPDTVLVDHMPVGAMGELKPMLDYAATRSRAPRMFLGLRDVLDRPAVIRRSWQELNAYRYLQVYDAVLIYGDRSVYDASAAYELLPKARAVVYCDYVAPRRRTRERLGTTPPFVLMMGGGGADAFPLARAFVEAISAVRRELPIEAVLLTGPNMPVRHRERLAASADGSVRVESRYGDATDWIEAAAAVVTMAGYNSLCEVLASQKKALVVPRRGPSAEQRIRSALFSERTLIRSLDPRRLDAANLASSLIALLADDRVPNVAAIPGLNGARLTANILLEWTPAVAAPRPAAIIGARSKTLPGVPRAEPAEASRR
jgi:predicted glycosyltransferase